MKDHEHRRVRCLHFYAAVIYAAKRHCRRRRAITERPQRRHGEQQDGHGRRAGNREGQRRCPDTPGDGSVGFGYGIAPETVLAGLERMAD